MINQTDKSYRWRGLCWRIFFFTVSILLFVQAWRNFDDSIFNFWTIAFIISIIAFIIFDLFMARTYRCPSCKAILGKPKIDEEKEDEYFHECIECNIRWYTKTFVPND